MDRSDVDSVGSSSTALSDLSISYATENVNSEEYVLDKCIDDLYEKRGSTRGAALAALVDAFESFILHGLVEDNHTGYYMFRWVVAVVARFPDDDPDDSDLYRKGKGVDLLAGVKAIISHLIVKEFKIPAAHAPVVLPLSLSLSVSPRSAAEEGETEKELILKGARRLQQVALDAYVKNDAPATSRTRLMLLADEGTQPQGKDDEV